MRLAARGKKKNKAVKFILSCFTPEGVKKGKGAYIFFIQICSGC